MNNLCDYCHAAPAYKTNGECKNECYDHAMTGKCAIAAAPDKKPLSIDDYIIPASKTDAILDYYRKLRRKHLHIKQERLIKRVAEYFHLKKKAVK